MRVRFERQKARLVLICVIVSFGFIFNYATLSILGQDPPCCPPCKEKCKTQYEKDKKTCEDLEGEAKVLCMYAADHAKDICDTGCEADCSDCFPGGGGGDEWWWRYLCI